MNPYLKLIRFDKPIGTLLLLYPTVISLFVAYNGHPDIKVSITFILGVFLTRSAGCAINDYADIEFDGSVERTKNRPLVSGEISKKQAIFVVILFSFIAFVLAMITLSVETLLLSIPALFIFITYPYMKRFIAIPQAYLGLAFSFGIIMVFIQSLGHATLITWVLFFANLCWVIAYDTLYALSDIEDDLKLGMKTSAITFGRFVLHWIVFFYSVFIVLLIVLGVLLDYHVSYYIALMIISLMIIYIVIKSASKDKYICFKMFLCNNYIGLILTCGVIINYYFRSI